MKASLAKLSEGSIHILSLPHFTAPPPAFALEQADWYVRSDLTIFLKSPVLLREVVQQYPVPEASIREAIN